MTWRTALAGLLLVACGSTATGPAPVTVAPSTPTPGPSASATATPLKIVENGYGRISVVTAAGSTCTVGIRVGPPKYGDLPPASVEGTADVAGRLTLTYAARQLRDGPPRDQVRHRQ